MRSRNGRPSVTDGPFAETKEQLGGFTLLDAVDTDEAIRLATALNEAAAREEQLPGRDGALVLEARAGRRSAARSAEEGYFTVFCSYSAIAFRSSVRSSQPSQQIRSSALRCSFAFPTLPCMRYASPMYSCAPRCFGSSRSASL